MGTLIAGLALFLGSHAFTRFRSLRDPIEARLGALPFKGLYSIVALAGFVLLIVGYGAYRAAGPIPVWDPPTALRHVSLLLMIPVFPLLFAAYVPGAIKAAVVHPMLAAVKVWALAHLIANGDLGSLLLFGGFLAWALFARIRLGKAERVKAAWSTGDWIAVGGGLGAYVLFVVWGHQALIGVPVVG